MHRRFSSIVLGLFTFFGLSVAAQAQGIIVPIVCDVRPCIPRPRPVPLLNVLPVRSIELDTKINAQVATTHVTQVFANETPYTLEGTYFFPIPETASIVEFAIWENGKRLVGEVRSREEARRIYDEIVRRQRDPGLLEYAGKDLFQASIFPIPPGTDKKLELTYTEVLKAESGTVAYRYPLGAGRNLWRGRPGGEPEGPVRAIPQRFGTISGKIEITGRNAVRNVYSPTHDIDVKRRNERELTASFETKGNDNDLQLFYALSNDEFGFSLITHREPGKDGYFLLSVSPRDDAAEREIVRKDVIFVLDTSGSMADAGKMEKARSALLFGIRSLRDGDRFNVISFAGEEHLMERGLIDADAAGKKRGEDFTSRLRPTGGTNINDSLTASLSQFESGSRPKMLVFMTDGLPTVGETNVDKILANAKAALKGDVRIFAFGFGYDVNTDLLDRLGAENSGISEYVQPKEDLEVKVSNFFAKVSSPVLSDVELDLGAVESELVYPRKITDLFRGTQVTLIGRYKNASDLRNITLLLRGKTAAESRAFRFSGADFPLRSDSNDFLPRLWASRRVGWLIEQVRRNGDTKEVRDEITELGTRYGIVTPYTSYLATDGSVAAAPRDEPARRVLADQAATKMREKSGSGAVRMSVQQNSMSQNASVGGGYDKDKNEEAGPSIFVPPTEQNRYFAGKNFFRENGVWIDSEFSTAAKLKEVVLKFGSEEYFRAASSDPDLARYFSLGEAVVVVWKGTVYRVVP